MTHYEPAEWTAYELRHHLADEHGARTDLSSRRHLDALARIHARLHLEHADPSPLQLELFGPPTPTTEPAGAP